MNDVRQRTSDSAVRRGISGKDRAGQRTRYASTGPYPSKLRLIRQPENRPRPWDRPLDTPEAPSKTSDSPLIEVETCGLDHMKVYTCGKKFLPTFSNRSMPVKSMAKANHSPNYGECLSL